MGFWKDTDPWQCPACGRKFIMGTRHTCPKCGAVKPGYESQEAQEPVVAAAAPASASAAEPQEQPAKKSGFWSQFQTWDCIECGKRTISANKQACPECYAPRPGTPDAEAEIATGQKVRTYEGERDMREGIARLARQGWRVASQSNYQPRAGLGRIALLGFGALVIKPKAKFTVIYERAS